MIKKDYACCFTGHRIIAADLHKTLPQRLELQIRQLIKQGTVDFITGGALGFDTLAAQAVLNLRNEFPDIRLILALPCQDQSKRWSKGDRDLYEEIRRRADFVHYTAQEYFSGCMMRRNRFMVDHSANCVFYLTNPRSGTYRTVAYAIEQGLQLYNILAVN